MSDGIATAFMATVELGLALGVTRLCDLTGCWEHRIDDQWWIAINGHREPTKTSDGTEVPPFSLLVRFNDWPAAVINPRGGTFVRGEGIGEDAYLAVVRAAIARAEAAP